MTRLLRTMCVIVMALVTCESVKASTLVDVVGNIPSTEFNSYIAPQAYKAWGNEPFIAVNPVNPDQIVISSFAYFSPGATNRPTANAASLWYSTDGGKSWGLRFPVTPGTNSTVPNDQVYAYDDRGILHGAVLSYGLNVWVGATTDPNNDGVNGRPASTWTWIQDSWVNSPTEYKSADQPWIATSGSRVYVAYNYFPGFGSNAEQRVTVSGDYGQTFSNNNAVNSGGAVGCDSNPGLRIAADRANHVYAIYCPSPSGTGYRLNRSSDGGQTWEFTGSTPVPGGLLIDSGVSSQIGSSFGGKNELRGNTTALASDTVGNHVYTVYGKQDASNVNRLWLAEFHASGSSLDLRSNPLPFSPAGEEAALPSVAVTENGDVGILYMTFANNRYNAHFALSHDQGLSFSDELLNSWDPSWISLGTSAFPSSNRSLGDYLFLTTIGDQFYGTFPAQGTVNAGGIDTTGMVVPMFFTETVPEPSTFALLGVGALVLLGWAWRRRK